VSRRARVWPERRQHPEGRFGLSRDLPIIVTVVDRRDNIARLLPVLDEMVASGIAVITNVEDVDVAESLLRKARTEHHVQKDS